ncbi:ribonuclease H-like domain-containing protein [Tanacetum coccineum]
MFAAIETRFGGNAATKKTQKTLLKQQYENFSATSAESLDSIFNRLQKIVSRLAILGVIIAQKDLNLKFLSSLPPEWNTNVVVWINKPEIETMSIHDLYNNFKIVEQKIKKTIGTSSGGQNLAFMTAPNSSSTNDANTAYSQVSAASPSVNTASPQVCTTSVSDNTVYAFMVENLNGSNVLHQDLEQIHEDDLEAMDLKWQLSLLSVRAKKYYQKTGKKIFINGNDIAGYDKSKVECYNCHKLGYFAKECKASRSKEDQFRNQDNTRKQGNKEDTSKAMLAIDGVGFDWSDMAEEQNNYETLKKQYDDLLAKQHQTKFEAATYKRGLDIVEAQLVTYRKNEVLFSVEVVVLKREVGIKQYEINMLKTEFEKVKQEKDGNEFKMKFDKASKDLDQFKNVSEVEPKKVRKNNDAPIIEDWVSDDEEQDSPNTKPGKENCYYQQLPIVVNTARQNRTSVNAAKENGFNTGKLQHDDKGFVDMECSSNRLVTQAYHLISRQYDRRICSLWRRFSDDSSSKDVNVVGQQVNTASPDVNTAEILKKFNYSDVKSASTPVDSEKPLVKDGDADDVDVHLYSIYDWVFDVSHCIYTIYHVCIAYPVYYYAGATLARKSTTEVLVFWETVAVDKYYGIQNKIADYGVNFITLSLIFDNINLLTKGFDAGRFQYLVSSYDEAVHEGVGCRMERAATTRFFLRKQSRTESIDPPLSRGYTLGSGEDSMKLIGIDEILLKLVLSVLVSAVKCMLMLPVQVSAVEVNPVIYTSCIEQFWATAKVQTVNGVRQLQALVDKKRVIVTESSIRRDLHLDDAEVFANMKRAGKDFSRRITPLFDTMMVQPVEEMGEDSDHPTDSTPIPIIDQPSSSSQPKKDKSSKKAQRQEAEVPQDEAEHEESVPTPSNDPQPSGEDSMQLTELMVLCTKLQTQVLDLQKAKDAQAKEIAALKKRIQRLEKRKISRPTGLKRLRKVGMSQRVEFLEDQGRFNDDLIFDTGVLDDVEMPVEAKVDGKDEQSTKTDDSTAGEAVTTAGDDSVVPTTNEEITLAQTLIQIKAAKPKTQLLTTTAQQQQQQDSKIGVVVQEPSEFRVPQEIKPSSSKDKGKGIMIEPEVPLKRKDQIALDEQIARDIQAKLDVELLEEQKLARKPEKEAKIALIDSWENTQL